MEALHRDDAAHYAPLAHHHAGAGQPAAACRYFVAAAQRAQEAYANEQASELYRAAAREAQAAGGDGAPELLTTILTRLGDLRQRTGDPAGALEDYAQALRHPGPA